MKVLIMCPGNFTAGLYSPERGEGRWSQNYARMLAQAGHDVYAASGGMWGRIDVHHGVKLVDQTDPSKYGPFDLYIESAWWEGRVPVAEAKKYVALKWSPENYLYEPFADNFYLAYPYVSHHYNFSRTNFPNRDKAFALPTMFATEFSKPNWDKSKVFLPGKIDINRPYQQYLGVVGDFLSSHPIEGTSRSFFMKEFGAKINFERPDSKWVDLMPYNEVMEAIERSKLSVPILNPGCVIEAISRGVPSVLWAHGGFFNPLAEMLNISIEHDAPPERFVEVTDLLMTNKKKYHEVVYTMQDYFINHTFSGAMKYFNLMAETIGLL